MSEIYNKKKELLLTFVPGVLSDLLYYDRKECEDVTREDVDCMFNNNLISKIELLNAFSVAIDEVFDMYKKIE